MQRLLTVSVIGIVCVSCSGSGGMNAGAHDDDVGSTEEAAKNMGGSSGGGGSPAPAPAPKPPAKPSCSGATYAVTRLDDRNSQCATNDCSLREAVIAANNCAGHNTITLPSGTINLTNGITITDSVTMQGAGSSSTTIDGGRQNSIFWVDHGPGATTVFSNLTIAHGVGAILALDNAGSGQGPAVQLSSVSLVDNATPNFGGAVQIVEGTLYVTNSEFAFNTSVDGGGAIDASLSNIQISGSTFIWNETDQLGGAIDAYQSNITIANSSLDLNRGIDGGGAIYIEAGSTLVASDSSFNDDSSDNGGGGLMAVDPGTTVTLSHCTLDYDIAAEGGAGLFEGSVSIEGSTISDNQATGGPGGGFLAYGPLQLVSSTMQANSAVTGSTYGPGSGGALMAANNLRVDSSTLSGNTADTEGGAIATQGFISSNTNLAAQSTIINSTLSANTAAVGGAVSHADGQLFIKSSTIVGNIAPKASALMSHGTGNLVVSGSATPQMHVNHSIVHKNGSTTSALCVDEESSFTGGATIGIDSYGFNLRGDNSCVFKGGTEINLAGSPGLGALADNGGLTETLLPATGSRAVDSGSTTTGAQDSDPGCAPKDERGSTRPVGTACDIGAVERQASDPAVQVTPAVANESPDGGAPPAAESPDAGAPPSM